MVYLLKIKRNICEIGFPKNGMYTTNYAYIHQEYKIFKGESNVNKDREKEIIKILLAEEQVTVAYLADKLYASRPSIRRDLANLEKMQLIHRTHGGAVLNNSSMADSKIPFILRELEHGTAKSKMGRAAAELVNDGDVILLDASTSAYNIIPFLANKKNLTVITSGLKLMQSAGEHGIKVLATGGELITSCMSLVGPEAYSIIERYTANLLFFSCRGLTVDGCATDFSVEENWVRRIMLRHAEKRVLLCDSSKIGKSYVNAICTVRDIDYIISEKPLPPPLDKKEYSAAITSV